MESTGKPSLRAGLGSRTGVMIIATVVSVIAAVLVLIAINAARSDNGGAAAASVLVANQLIPKGSSGQAIASGHLFRPANVSDSALVGGAVTDISQITDKVATADILPGQQISTSNFGGANGALTADLAAGERAITIALDGAHGMVGNIRTGDHVDVLAGFNLEQNTSGARRAVMKLLDRNVPVLKAPSGESDTGSAASQTKEVTLKVSDRKAAQIAFAGDNGKVWIVLRPAAGSEDSQADLVTLQSLLFGVKPVSNGKVR